jgi:hypothetical protein
MSDLKIGLVAEGPTDVVVIQAALKAILQERDFILTLLQPEATQPMLGTGWCGVLKWCAQAATAAQSSLSASPLFEQFDLLILHVDLDVLSSAYSDCGVMIQNQSIAKGRGALPVTLHCPPIINWHNELINKIHSWLGAGIALENKAIFCLPAQSSGTWLAAAVLPVSHPLLLNAAECNASLERHLSILPKEQRIKKTRREYEHRAATLSDNWDCVKQLCSQAKQFERDVLAVV